MAFPEGCIGLVKIGHGYISSRNEEAVKTRTDVFQNEYLHQRLLDNSERLIEEFINDQVIGHGLDERTVKAYRLDLEHLYRGIWKNKVTKENALSEKAIKNYLEYLINEKKLRPSTVLRKYRVICYYLEYLSARGESACIQPSLPSSFSNDNGKKEEICLSKIEIDRFFNAIDREYGELDSFFRKRICLRDCVMMRLLFYCGLEISQLLKLECSDYNRKTKMLSIQSKHQKEKNVYLFSKELQKQMEDLLNEHEYFEQDEQYSNRLFLSKLGRPLSMKMVINIFDKYRVMAEIEKEVTPKDLKNSMTQYAKELMVEQCG